MVGRDVLPAEDRRRSTPRAGAALLQVRDLTCGARFRSVSFSVCAGEIVGLAGLVGAGRSELARSIFGMDTYQSGTVHVDGRPIDKGNPRHAIARGLVMIPEDRQHNGLVLPMSVAENLTMTVLDQITRCGFIRRSRQRTLVQRLFAELGIRAASPRAPVAQLSGGNQQKVVLGKWLARQPRVLILDEPTAGIDVGAKAQVHRLVRDLADRGMASLFISSELAELTSLCDRVLVMRRGRLSGEFVGATVTQQQILKCALPDEVVDA